VQNALIFCNRKRDVDILYKSLTRHGFSVGALHGDMTQSTRFATLEKFKANELRLLACSDVAARGIDIGGLSHVFNFDVPHHAEDYVHRIGRTGRAGREGRAFTLATPEDRLAVEAIEKLIGAPIPRLQVEGLDPVTWAEGKSRGGRRGRGGKPAPLPPKAAAKPLPRPIVKPPIRPPVAPAMEARAPDRQPDRGRERVRPDRPYFDRSQAERPAVDRAREIPIRDRPPEPGREDPRRRFRDDDLGPSVTGFGDEIPAFMLLPKRGRRPEPDEVVTQTTAPQTTDGETVMEASL
jgi:superfamily II DNA/RNA helicase